MQANISGPRAVRQADEEITSPENNEPATKIICPERVLIVATDPPYDEDPLDLTLGLHFHHVLRTEIVQKPNDPVDSDLIDRFKKMKDVCRFIYLPVWLSLCERSHTIFSREPLREPRRYISVEVKFHEDWHKVHDVILRMRKTFFSDVDLPIRYYEIVPSFEGFDLFEDN